MHSTLTGSVALAVLSYAALLISRAHASSETEALGEMLDQTQDPGVAKQLNDLLAWSIGSFMLLLQHNVHLIARNPFLDHSACVYICTTSPLLAASYQAAEWEYRPA